MSVKGKLSVFDWEFRVTNFTLSDFSLKNIEHFSDKERFEFIIGTAVLIFAVTGICANFLVVILSFGHVQGDFRFFVANSAIVDILCGTVFVLVGYINITDNHHIPSKFLYYMMLAFYGSFGIMICAIVPISLNRILTLTKTSFYSRFFEGWRSLVLCVFIDVFPFGILCLICVVDHNIAKILFYTLAVVTCFAYFLAFATNYMVFHVVAKHIKTVVNLRDKTKLLETRQIAVATLAQAIIPLVCQVPAFFTFSSVLFLSEPVTNRHVIIITQLWLALSPFLDAVITIIVIKQYRKFFFHYAFKLKENIWKIRKAATKSDEELMSLEIRLQSIL